jgi:hypothetical protein
MIGVRMWMSEVDRDRDLMSEDDRCKDVNVRSW